MSQAARADHANRRAEANAPAEPSGVLPGFRYCLFLGRPWSLVVIMAANETPSASRSTWSRVRGVHSRSDISGGPVITI